MPCTILLIHVSLVPIPITTEAMTQLIHALTIFQRYQVMLITQTAEPDMNIVTDQ